MNVLKLKDVEAMIAMDEHRSVTAAAASLHLTQSAVTKRIKRLEELLGVLLFDRSTPRGELTEFGACLVAHGRAALAEIQRAHLDLITLRDLSSNRISIGALPWAAADLVPRAVSSLLRAVPHVFVSVIEGSIEALLPQLETGALDVIVGPLHYGNTPDWLVERELLTFQLNVVSRDGHPVLANERISLQKLTEYEWIVPPRELPAYQKWHNAFLSEGLNIPRIRVETSSTTVMRGLLMQTDCLAAVSSYLFATEIQQGMLTQLDTPLVTASRSVGYMNRLMVAPSEAMEHFRIALVDAAERQILR